MKITLDICGFRKDIDVSHEVNKRGRVEVPLYPPMAAVVPPSGRTYQQEMTVISFFRGHPDEPWEPHY